VLFSFYVDDVAETACSIWAEEPKMRSAVVKELRRDLCMPHDVVERWKYQMRTWGLDAPNNRGVDFDLPTFNDPGDGAV
jgi:hypothetical protein